MPLYLGVKAGAVKSFARIHKANLINSGILPLVFLPTRPIMTTSSRATCSFYPTSAGKLPPAPT